MSYWRLRVAKTVELFHLSCRSAEGLQLLSIAVRISGEACRGTFPVSHVLASGGDFRADVLSVFLAGQERTGSRGRSSYALRYVMAKKYESKSNIENLTDAEIYAAIRDLEPDRRRATELDADAIFLICISLWILLLGFLGFIWLYP